MKYNIGDEILINVYSDNCDCVRNAKVTDIKDNQVYANLSVTTTLSCITCAETNSKNSKGENTCKWSTSKFNIEDIELNTKELV